MSMRWRRPRQSISKPPCTSPSRCMRAPTPTSSRRSTLTCSSTPARMRASTCAPLCRSTITASIPAFARSCPSSRPAGPAPTIATCVRATFGRPASAWSRRLHALAALRVRRRRRGHEREQRARVVRLRARARRPPAEKVVTIWIAGGNGPSTSMPVDVDQLRELLEAELDSPRATSAPTGTPGGGVTIRSRIRSAMPQRSNSFASATPLGPVEYPIVRRRLHRAPEGVLAADLGPRRAGAAPRPRRRSAPDRPRCRRRGARPRAACRSRRAPAPRRRTAHRPARGRAASTPPTDSIATRRAANEPRTRSPASASTAFVAIDEMPADRVGARALNIRHPYMLT